MAEEQTGATVQDPTAAQPGAAPWSADLAAQFPDEAVRAQVDAYLRANIQPRVTQLEQEVASAKDAKALWEGFGNQPYETLVSVIDQLFDPETAQSVYSALTGQQGPEAQAAAEEVVADAAAQQQVTPPPQQAPLEDPRLTPERLALLERIEAEEVRKTYMGNLEERIAAVGQDMDADMIRAHVHSFVVAADGDIDEGIARLRAFAQEFGVPATAKEVEQNAPTVLTGEGAPANGAPLAKDNNDWESAWADFKAEQMERRTPPPVGTA